MFDRLIVFDLLINLIDLTDLVDFSTSCIHRLIDGLINGFTD